jgi:hypothetical protein
MPDPIPPSLVLIPPSPELRHRLAIALREVDILRRLIRVSEYATRYARPRPIDPATERKGERNVA